jgi:conserved oligomeric Golgi complex subunit 4
MAECLEYDDPVAALMILSASSARRASALARTVSAEIHKQQQQQLKQLPDLLVLPNSSSSHLHLNNHPLETVIACGDSVHMSLIEIRLLEREKREVDQHAAAVELALTLRRASDRAAQSHAGSAWLDAAEALQPWLLWKDQNDENGSGSFTSGDDGADPRRVRAYAGEYSLQQLQSTYDKLRQSITTMYEGAVQSSDLQVLSQLTPILALLRLEQDGVRLYGSYLETILDQSLAEAAASTAAAPAKSAKQQTPSSTPPPYAPMGRVYNTAVAALRHHLPMVSHCLFRADGAAAVVRLVHGKTERAVLPLLQQYQRDRQLARVARTATRIYSDLEQRYTGRGHADDDQHHENGDDGSGNDDCGFTRQIGSLADVDVAMKEAALCIQHAESYVRFVRYSCDEVNRARRLRHEHEQSRLRLERERREWTSSGRQQQQMADVDRGTQETKEAPYEDLEILPAATPLQEAIAELGGQYATIERCLLLASMQRAFVQASYDDPRYYRPMSTLVLEAGSGGGSDQALQTTLVEACFFAARRAMQRALATGHTGTASGVTNFSVECMNDVLLEVMTRRAEDLGVHPLKPGEGLLVGSANLFNNASNLIRHGGAGVAAQPAKRKEELMRKQKVEQGIAQACAMLNDLEVAVHHTSQLEETLNRSIDTGFPPDTHATERLLRRASSLRPTRQSNRSNWF